jgi:glutaminyl-tRNA synthetase
VKCTNFVKDKKTGAITEIHCTYDPATRGGDAPDGRKVKATLHWVSAKHAVGAEVRFYDVLFTKRDPGDIPEGSDFRAGLNPNSLVTLKDCKLEPSLANAAPGSRYQFERLGYFYLDPEAGGRVFNRVVTLKDEWAKLQKKH